MAYRRRGGKLAGFQGSQDPKQGVGTDQLSRKITQKVLIRDLQASLNFLDNWPVGLKLNTPLSNVFCQVFGAMAETAFGTHLSHSMISSRHPY